jgi:hypothetical protein
VWRSFQPYVTVLVRSFRFSFLLVSRPERELNPYWAPSGKEPPKHGCEEESYEEDHQKGRQAVTQEKGR